MKEMKYHPSGDAFPELPESQLTDLAKDIAAHGQKFPIITLEGAIVDGRNRYLACQLAGVTPWYQEIKRRDGTPESYVKSVNVFRRHLTTGQRAMFAEKLVNATKGRKARDGSKDPSLTTTEAANLFKVSAGSVKRAKTIKDNGIKELQQSVENGKVKLGRAARIAKLPKEKQATALTVPEPRTPRGGLYAEKLRADRVLAQEEDNKLTDVATLAKEIADEARERAAREQAKNGVKHEMPGSAVAWLKMGRRDLAAAVEMKFPATSYDEATTVGDMVREFLAIAERVLG